MKDMNGRVAVITGAASGIGRALAERCVREGMKVVLADLDSEALAEVEAELNSAGRSALAVRTDVSRAGDVEALAHKTLDAFGAVHLLCNNAGVAKLGSLWDTPLTDWECVVGVNLWGVIHGVRVFVPVMLAQNTECHIVNTASMSGLLSVPGTGAYNVTKHGIVTLSETLHHELAERGAKIKVSVLCPGIVRTRIMDPRQVHSDTTATVQSDPRTEALINVLRELVQSGMPPAQVAAAVFEAIREDRFYILTHPEGKVAFRTRMDDILQERNPTPLAV
jgi:NAD(P)-dependent dehydrogenase (short-subunit alcohol dehydrogenase family)